MGLLVNVVNLISIITTKGLPAIEVYLGTFSTLALIDSASSLNLLKNEVFKRCLLDNRRVQPSQVKVKGVNGIVS